MGRTQRSADVGRLSALFEGDNMASAKDRRAFAE